MSPTHLVILAVATLVVWGLAMTFGRRLIDRLFPAINRALDALDDRAASADERGRRADYRRVQGASPKDLVPEVERILDMAAPRAVPRAEGVDELLDALPPTAQRFFREHDRFVVSSGDALLDIGEVRARVYSGDTFIIVGRSSSDENDALYAVRKGDSAGRIVVLELDENSDVAAVVPESDSLEHFIASHFAVHGVEHGR